MAKVDWKSIVGTVAPGIATALGGPLAGVAVRALSEKLLGHSDGSEADVEAAIMGATPDTLLKMKELDYDFKKHMSDAGIELEKLASTDRANAREREIKTGDSWTPRIIASLIIVGWFSIQWYLLRHVIPTEMREIIMRTLGTLDMALGLVLGYYFGSSASGRNKDETISNIAKGR
jgi:hypothetical protein